MGGKRVDNRWKERIRLPLMELIVDAGREVTLGGLCSQTADLTFSSYIQDSHSDSIIACHTKIR